MAQTNKDRRLAIIREIRRLRKHIAWTLSAGGGLVSLAFAQLGWEIALMVGAVCVILGLLLLQATIVWRLTRRESGEWFDREYLLLRNAWTYSLASDRAALVGECLGERRFICKSGTISSITIAIGPKENLLPLDPAQSYEVALVDFSRSRGTVSIRDPHRKEGASFAFQIDFNPPLTEGEEAYVKFRYKIPRLKIANYEALLEKSREAKLGPRDYEYNAFTIVYPTRRFEYDLLFLPECRVKPKAIEVKRGTDIFPDEQDLVLNGRHFKCEETLGAWRMTLHRDNPPLHTTYRLMWHPPRLIDLENSNDKLALAAAPSLKKHTPSN